MALTMAKEPKFLIHSGLADHSRQSEQYAILLSLLQLAEALFFLGKSPDQSLV